MSSDREPSEAELSTEQQHRSQDGVARIESVEISSYAGPLPHPEILAKFEQLLPGAAKRIFDDFEMQAAHRRALERQVIQAEAFRQLAGSISAGLIGLLGVSGGVWLAHEGRDLSGLVALLGTLGSLLTVYLARGKERDDRDPGSEQ